VNEKAQSPTGGAKHIELSGIHDFAAKLLQPETLPKVREYVRWRAGLEQEIPDFAPVSINLDITTACNFACDHCVDMEILNTGIRYEHDRLMDSLRLMADKGLKSVIVIGGGEPTVYPKFVESVLFMKELGLQVSVVSNGSGMKKVAQVADALEEGDWVRLSLDSASEDVFQRMHKPKKPITLNEICEGARCLPARRWKLGYSFIVTWAGAFINDATIVENIHEMVDGARRAREYGFDYIAFKPFLTRAPYNNAEIVDLNEGDDGFDDIRKRIRAAVEEAKKLETESFRIYETTNLKVLENRSAESYMRQPHHCHMQFFRQVLSPLGMYNCPVYRNQPHGCVGPKDAYATSDEYDATRGRTAGLIQSFDAHHECREVTCLYNHVNWWIEDLVRHPEKLDVIEAAAAPEEPDFFL
jgi:wyosine [tRNA(Phe)-imidazoG37] synthetase (radical SAM superfamily)